MQGEPCRGSRGAKPLAGRDQSEDLRGHKRSRRGGEKGSAKSPVLQSHTRFDAESDLCGKQPPGVERRESHRINKESVINDADDEKSNSRYIMLHTVIAQARTAQPSDAGAGAMPPLPQGSGGRGAHRT